MTPSVQELESALADADAALRASQAAVAAAQAASDGALADIAAADREQEERQRQYDQDILAVIEDVEKDTAELEKALGQ